MPKIQPQYNMHDNIAVSSRRAVDEIFQAKEAVNLTITDIADKLGYTNAYMAQILLLQAPLNPDKKDLLNECLNLSDDTLNQMIKANVRRYDPHIQQEPAVYRIIEAALHYGDGIKMIVNEQCGDGIMSAIDMYVDVKVIKGKNDEQRVAITFNGKYLPFIEQNSDDNTAKFCKGKTKQ